MGERGQGKGWAPGEGAILPRGVPYEEGGAIILNNKMCRAAGGEMEGRIFLLLLLFHFSEWAGLSGRPLGNRGGEGDGDGARVVINGDYFCPHTFPGRISAGRRRRVPRAPVLSCSQPRGRGGRRWGGERGAPERIVASSAPRGPAGRGGAGDSRERRGRAGCGAARPQPRHPPAPLSPTRGATALLPTLSPFPFAHTPPPPPHFLAGEGDACLEDGSWPE